MDAREDDPVAERSAHVRCLNLMISRVEFAGFDQVIICEEDEQGDPVTLGQWLREYRDAIADGTDDLI